MQPLQIYIGPIIRIGRESWCLPYAGFFHHFSLNQRFSQGVITHVLFSLPINFFPGLSSANTGHMTHCSCELCWPMKSLEICPQNFW